jgi:hypothetical protein
MTISFCIFSSEVAHGDIFRPWTRPYLSTCRCASRAFKIAWTYCSISGASDSRKWSGDTHDRYGVIGDEIVGKGSNDFAFISAERARYCLTNISNIELSIVIPQLSEPTFDRVLIASP